MTASDRIPSFQTEHVSQLIPITDQPQARWKDLGVAEDVRNVAGHAVRLLPIELAD